jgi:hypothetical protein
MHADGSTEYANRMCCDERTIPTKRPPLVSKANANFCGERESRDHINAENQLQHPYKSTGKIIALYVLILITLGSICEDKYF